MKPMSKKILPCFFCMGLAMLLSAASVYDFDWTVEKDDKFGSINSPALATVHGDASVVSGHDGGKALLFDGKSGYVEAPPCGNPEVLSGEAWINIKGPSANKRNIVMVRRGKGNQWQFWLENEGSSHRLYFFAWNNKAPHSLAVTAKSGSLLTVNKWYHVAFEMDSDKRCRIFINGEVSFDGKPVATCQAGASPLRIGGDGNHCFNGLIGEVKLYDSALDVQRIAAVQKSLLPVWKQEMSHQEAMGFERDGAWVTAPVEVFDLMPADKLWHLRTRGAKESQIKARSNASLALGASLSDRHATEGKYSLRWNNHPANPTLHSNKVIGDWSGAATLSIDVYSAVATNQIVVIALHSDSPETPWKDFYYFPVIINWQGSSTLRIPLCEFRKYSQPGGFDRIGGLSFYTKAFGCKPDPRTELYMDNLRMETQSSGDDWKGYMAQLPDDKHAEELFVERTAVEWQRGQMNHTGDETSENREIFAPYAYQNYFRNEADLFAYYPRFIPGYPSFDLHGKAYINSGDVVQWKGEDGKWLYSDILAQIKDWAKKQGWKGLRFAWSQNQSEKAIRFDQDNDAYLLVQVEQLDVQGKPISWMTRGILLLHSSDKMKSWDIYKLPGRTAEFEKIDGHNHDCLKRPPVILIGDYKYFKEADQRGYLLLPVKQSNGKLSLSQVVKFADNCISVCQHSGGGNQALTVGDKVYIVYGWYVEDHLRNGDWHKSCPPIPSEHPAKKQSYKRKTHSESIEYAVNGIPTFIRSYNMKNGQLSEPVFLGYGGGTYDNHNWPAITVDQNNILHVIINGHHNPVNYTRSLKPDDISAWTAPQYIMVNTDLPNLSYATLNCDRTGNIYCVHRSTKDIYNNHLGLYVMRPDGRWEEEKTLVTPFRYMYKVWGHKMTYNPVADKLYLSFYGQSSMKQLSRDQYEFDIFIWPEHEKLYYAGFGGKGLNPGPPPPTGTCHMFTAPASELVILTSEPPGKWKLSTSGDYQ